MQPPAASNTSTVKRLDDYNRQVVRPEGTVAVIGSSYISLDGRKATTKQHDFSQAESTRDSIDGFLIGDQKVGLPLGEYARTCRSDVEKFVREGPLIDTRMLPSIT